MHATACGSWPPRQLWSVYYTCADSPHSVLSVQVAKSLFWRNRATYGGGAYLSSGNTLVKHPECDLLPEREPIFQPVHFLGTTFIENLCGPSQAGASIFWNTPYLLHITCLDEAPVYTPYQPGLSNCSKSSAGSTAQHYCHQCVLVDGCPDWEGNTGAPPLSESGDGVQSQGLPTGQALPSATAPIVIVPVSQQRVSYALSPWHPSQPRNRSVGPNPGRRLPSAATRPDGMASGGVALRTKEHVVAEYAAGAEMNISVDLLDAYGQIVNTDEFVATRPGAPLPVVSVSHGRGDVFLSGQLTQQFKAGFAELKQLRLIGYPGKYRLTLESAGAEPTFVEVCSWGGGRGGGECGGRVKWAATFTSRRELLRLRVCAIAVVHSRMAVDQLVSRALHQGALAVSATAARHRA